MPGNSGIYSKGTPKTKQQKQQRANAASHGGGEQKVWSSCASEHMPSDWTSTFICNQLHSTSFITKIISSNKTHLKCMFSLLFLYSWEVLSPTKKIQCHSSVSRSRLTHNKPLNLRGKHEHMNPISLHPTTPPNLGLSELAQPRMDITARSTPRHSNSTLSNRVLLAFTYQRAQQRNEGIAESMPSLSLKSPLSNCGKRLKISWFQRNPFNQCPAVLKKNT